MPIKLYDLCGANQSHRFSPFCWRAKMAISHKGFQIEEVPTPFSKIKEVAGGISATVPVIEDGGNIVSDSWDIANYLEDNYSDRPSLFGGETGLALCKFFESWVNLTLHRSIGILIVKDVHDILSPEDQKYFRESREKRFGRSLESVHNSREAEIEVFNSALSPVRRLLKYQPYISGKQPLFSDYILFGTLQWVNVACTLDLLSKDDPITDWFNRCLELFDGIGSTVVRVQE